MKEFDFADADFLKHSSIIQAFLRDAYKSGMTEDKFIAGYKALTPSSGRSPSRLRYQYRKLTQEFNFF